MRQSMQTNISPAQPKKLLDQVHENIRIGSKMLQFSELLQQPTVISPEYTHDRNQPHQLARQRYCRHSLQQAGRAGECGGVLAAGTSAGTVGK